jgi:hypothetical protein
MLEAHSKDKFYHPLCAISNDSIRVITYKPLAIDYDISIESINNKTQCFFCINNKGIMKKCQYFDCEEKYHDYCLANYDGQ